MEEYNRPKRTVKKRKKRGAWPLLLLLFLILLAVLAMSPVCNVTEIEVSGNERVAEETVLDAVGDVMGKNIFRLSTGRIGKKIAEIPYIRSASVKRVLPGKLRILLEESELCLFLPMGGEMLAVSREGKVADVVQADNAVGAPVAKGITVKKYEIGKSVETEETEELAQALDFTDTLKEYGLFQKVTEITPDATNLTFVLGYHLKVEFGTEEEASYKMKYLKGILDEVGDATDGVLNIRSVDHPTYREGSAEREKVSTATEPPEAEEEAPTAEATMVPEPE